MLIMLEEDTHYPNGFLRTWQPNMLLLITMKHKKYLTNQ